MKIVKSIATVAVIAGICGTSALAAGQSLAAPDGAISAIAGCMLIGLSSALRRRFRRTR